MSTRTLSAGSLAPCGKKARIIVRTEDEIVEQCPFGSDYADYSAAKYGPAATGN